MTATYAKQPLSGYPLITRKRKGKATQGETWGTPTGEEMATLLDSIQAALEGASMGCSEAIALLSDSHAMLLRCQAALPAAETRCIFRCSEQKEV
jgi:hypothetical protein